MKKGVSDISGLRRIKSLHSEGKRSIPRVQSSGYLDLFMLGKEKDRLEQEMSVLDRRKKDIQRRLDDINKDMEKLKKEEAKRKETISQEYKRPLEKEWKTMPLKY